MATEEKVYSRQVTKKNDGTDAIRYKLNNAYTKGAEVPEKVQEALAKLPAGATVNAEGAEVVVEPKAPAKPSSTVPAQQSDQSDSDFEEISEDEVEETEDEVAAREAAEAVAGAQPKTPAQLDKAARAGAAPDVKADKVPTPEVPKNELPGGPQEPVVPTPDLQIDSADDVDDESGADVEEQDRIARMVAGREQDERGMGFPMNKDGKTVDIFDKKTPHTHVRNVAGIMVPLNQENFEKRSDSEIHEVLRKLGKIK